MTAPKRKKKPSQSYLTRKADAAFSKWIRQRDGHCQSGRSYTDGCEMIYNLQCAHLLSRRYFGTRWDRDNAVALCRACHLFFTHHPVEWELWMEERLGPKCVTELRRRALRPWKGDKNEVAAHYSALFEEAA